MATSAALAVVHSRALVAMAAPAVAVEVHLGTGLPAFNIVGLPQAEVRESRERVRAALLNLGYDFPNRRITVNLAPADLPKESGRFDLPIALGILVATGQMEASQIEGIEAVGELSLNGEVRPIRGAIAMALAIRRAGQNRTLMLPRANADEAALIGSVRLKAIGSLAELNPAKPAPPLSHTVSAPVGFTIQPGLARERVDFSQVYGHAVARRMLEIAAAGEHSVLLLGPPGAGKSMLAQRLPTIMPPLTEDEAAEVAALASLCGRFNAADWGTRPYRSPHHTASAPALVGGGSNPRPGEISLAHQGILFLDELPEFSRPVLEALREPLETGRITLSRALHHIDFPARFQFIGAMNPCPCGYFGRADGRCRCTPDQVQRYRSRLSGPLLDRIDLQLEVASQPVTQLLDDGRADQGRHQPSSRSPAVAPEQAAAVESPLASAPPASHSHAVSGAPRKRRQATRASAASSVSTLPALTREDSHAIRRRVIAARERAMERQRTPNARLEGDQLLALHDACNPAARRMLHQVVAHLSLSARAMTRTIKVARTIADLAHSDEISADHVAEATQFRRALSGY